MKIKYVISVFLFMLFGLIVGDNNVLAAEKLPEIVKWENGKGYNQDGEVIADGWAVDTINIAGKYVQFDEDGQVIMKIDDFKDRDKIKKEELYSNTDQVRGKVSYRAKVFSGFQGSIVIKLVEKAGVEFEHILSFGNQYEYNTELPRGDYKIKDVKAFDDEDIFNVKYSDDQKRIIGSNSGLVFSIEVINERISSLEKLETGQLEESESVLPKPSENKIDSEATMDHKKLKTGLFIVLVLSVILILLKSRKDKSNIYD